MNITKIVSNDVKTLNQVSFRKEFVYIVQSVDSVFSFKCRIRNVDIVMGKEKSTNSDLDCVCELPVKTFDHI